MAGKTTKYYKSGTPGAKAALEKKREYQKEYNKSPKAVKHRVECNKANRKAGTYGNGDGKDASHTKSGKIVMEKASTNRARQGANGKSTKK